MKKLSAISFLRRAAFLLAALLTTSVAQAQEWEGSITTINSVVPPGWQYTAVHGDLDKDGNLDMAILAYPNDSTHIIVREDGYAYNFNQPVLFICHGKDGNRFTLWKRYDNVVPGRPDEYIDIDASVDITPRGTLQISLEMSASMGSWQNSSATYTFRWQNGDFFLIGKDEDSLARNTGVHTVVSENYLTHKRQTVENNAFDTRVKRKEQWTKLPRTALQRLGATELEI